MTNQLGMFATPQQIQAAELQKQAADPNAALRASLLGVGQAGAGAFSRAFGGEGVPLSPEVQLAKTRQEAMQGVHFSNRESLIKGVQSLSAAGDYTGAQQLASQIPEAAKRETQFIDIPGTNERGEAITTKALAYKDTGEVIRELGTGKKGKGVQVYTGREKEENKAKVRIAEKDFNSVSERGDAANRAIATIDQARALLTDEAFQTGKLEPLKAEISGFAESLGFDPTTLGLETATNPQQFRAAMNTIVLGKAEQMKGNLSDKDVRFLKASEASLSSTKDANRFILNAGKGMAEMEQTKADFYRDQYANPEISLTQINNRWRTSPMNVPVVGQAPSGQPIFWNQYFEKMIEVNQNNPDYIEGDGSFNQQRLLKDISKTWKNDYGVK